MSLSAWERQREVEWFIKHALEASVYASPRENGLSEAELIEVGNRHGFEAGEISDLVHGRSQDAFLFDRGRMRLGAASLNLIDFNWTWPGDPRDPQAYEFVLQEFEAIARKEGAAHAKIDHSVLVARGKERGLATKDIEVSIASYQLDGIVRRDENDVLTRSLNRAYVPPSQQLQNRHERNNYPSTSILATVSDVVSRRNDGRSKQAEPLDAFGGLLERTRNAKYRLWWEHTRSELRRADPSLTPTSTLVLAAALAEGALALVALDVRQSGETMTGKLLDEDPKRWKFKALVGEARGGTRPMVTPALSERCNELNRERQRIHAGSFLSDEVPVAKIDIRPDEARRAKETLDQLLRSILDWFA